MFVDGIKNQSEDNLARTTIFKWRPCAEDLHPDTAGRGYC